MRFFPPFLFFLAKVERVGFRCFFFLSGAAQSRDSLIAYSEFMMFYTYLSYACYPTSYNWGRPGSLLRKGRPQRVPHLFKEHRQEAIVVALFQYSVATSAEVFPKHL